MLELPSSAAALAALAFGLGLRHGLDADHLAAVDALTRMHTLAGRAAARWCGLRFALGHGAVVLVVALGAALAHEHWALPAWFDQAGAGLSIALLFALGMANLRALLGSARDSVAPPAGLRSRWLQYAGCTPDAATIGALFAVSFDTLGLAALFGLAGAHGHGLGAVVGLAILFAAGMALVDGANGLWVARLLGGHGPVAAAVSRAIAWAVTVLSLGVAAFGTVRLAWPDGPADGALPGALQSAAALALVATSWLFARWSARRRVASAAAHAA